MAYSEKVIDHYENPRNVGSFDNSDESVGSENSLFYSGRRRDQSRHCGLQKQT